MKALVAILIVWIIVLSICLCAQLSMIDDLTIRMANMASAIMFLKSKIVAEISIYL